MTKVNTFILTKVNTFIETKRLYADRFGPIESLSRSKSPTFDEGPKCQLVSSLLTEELHVEDVLELSVVRIHDALEDVGDSTDDVGRIGPFRPLRVCLMTSSTAPAHGTSSR